MNMVAQLTKEPRQEKFGYICHRCSNCCYHKHIQINPYEVARLARNRGQTTSEFCAGSTMGGAGTVLKQTETGACVFLGSEGCTVHADRPLVCRLYPLGRNVQFDGTERFSNTDPHPRSAGEYTRKGTIADFLESQGAAPFIQAADEYFFWLCAAREYFGDGAGPCRSENLAEDGELAAALYDIDAAIARYCTANAVDEPMDIEDRKRLHLAILYQQIGDGKRSPK